MPRKMSPLEKRLSELREQSEMVDRDIRSLSKVLRKPGAVEMPELRSRQLEQVRAEAQRMDVGAQAEPLAEAEDLPVAVAEPEPAPAPVPAPDPVPARPPRTTPAAASRYDAWTEEPVPQLNRTKPTPGAPDLGAEEGEGTLGREARRRQLQDAGRFANYLASGSFGKSRPLVMEKRMQRNKAIFMLIVAAVVIFIFFKAVL